MKIDFNGQEMSIKFDKVPRLLYFNEEGKGCGKVFLSGVQIKCLQDIKIQAHTAGPNGWPPLKYRIQYIEPGTKGEPQFISNMKEELCIGVKILDIKEFSGLLEWVNNILDDARIGETVRKEHFKTLKEFTNRFEEGE